MPPKVEYQLTDFGKSIIPVLESMCDWGSNYLSGLDLTVTSASSETK
nr:winged helix-turn-helix transcriptional regulator [Robinsoniella peoriensis]